MSTTFLNLIYKYTILSEIFQIYYLFNLIFKNTTSTNSLFHFLLLITPLSLHDTHETHAHPRNSRTPGHYYPTNHLPTLPPPLTPSLPPPSHSAPLSLCPAPVFLPAFSTPPQLPFGDDYLHTLHDSRLIRPLHPIASSSPPSLSFGRQ